jgi:hypothetical protein
VHTAGPGATEADLDAAMAYAGAQPELSGNWVFNLIDPPSEFSFGVVLVAGFTADLDRHRAALRDLWSGPICVFERDVALADLRSVVDDLRALGVAGLPESIFGLGGYGIDVVGGVVRLDALLVTADGRDWLDERYGPGRVQAAAQLEPAVPTGD